MSTDGARVVAVSNDGLAMVWDAQTGAYLRTLDDEHADDVQCVAISADGSRVVTRSDDMLTKVWDAETGACLRTLDSHTNSVSSVAISADGARRHRVKGHCDDLGGVTLPPARSRVRDGAPPPPWRRLPRQRARPGARAADREAGCRPVLGQTTEPGVTGREERERSLVLTVWYRRDRQNADGLRCMQEGRLQFEGQ